MFLVVEKLPGYYDFPFIHRIPRLWIYKGHLILPHLQQYSVVSESRVPRYPLPELLQSQKTGHFKSWKHLCYIILMCFIICF